jgi:hypothetical protein
VSGHTPGPWQIRPSGAVGTDQMMVASVYPMEDEFPEENFANARLIAAAPNLLAALQRLELSANTVAYCYDKRPENFAVALREMQDDAETARAALAKATGAQS